MTQPFIERELKVALRRQHPGRSRFWLAAGCGAVSLFFVLISAGAGQKNQGGELHKLLFWVAIILICQVPRGASGVFAEERRNGTLGLLFLCGIRPGELFFGKLIGAALVAFTSLVGLFPFLAISFFTGGVSMELFTATLACLPVLLIFTFAVSTLASVLTEDEGGALFVALLIGGGLCLATPVVYWANGIFSDTQTLSRNWLTVSPAFPAWVVGTNLTGGTPAQFWTGCAMTFVWSLVCLGTAGMIVTRVWQDKPEATADGSFRARLQTRWRGDFAWRRVLAVRWLDTHPFVWLAARDRRLVSLAWMVVGTLSSLWIAACICWPRQWPGTMNFFLTATVFNLALHWITLSAAAKVIGENRGSGGLELLLCTPLKETEIVHGQLVALKEQFRPVAMAVIGIELLMMLAGFFMRDWTWLAAIVYLLIWTGLMSWTASYTGSYRFTLTSFWDSLVCERPSYVAWKLSGFAVSPLWLGWMMITFGRSLSRPRGFGMKTFPEGTIGEIFFLIVTLLMIFLFWLSHRREHRKRETRLLAELRMIAQEPPPEPSDPRYKEWKSGERFPENPQYEIVKRNARRFAGRTTTGTNR